MHVTRPHDRHPRPGPGMLAVIDHRHSVHQHALDSGAELLGALKGGPVRDSVRVENDDVAGCF